VLVMTSVRPLSIQFPVRSSREYTTATGSDSERMSLRSSLVALINTWTCNVGERKGVELVRRDERPGAGSVLRGCEMYGGKRC
jgi:hypothetical protein